MLNIKVFGIVQGVGFRPFVKRIADDNKILGSVANRGSYVEISAQGADFDLENFIDDLKTKNPPRSTILKVDINALPDKNFSDFQRERSRSRRYFCLAGYLYLQKLRR